jgi:hypothetical protein
VLKRSEGQEGGRGWLILILSEARCLLVCHGLLFPTGRSVCDRPRHTEAGGSVKWSRKKRNGKQNGKFVRPTVFM